MGSDGNRPFVGPAGEDTRMFYTRANALEATLLATFVSAISSEGTQVDLHFHIMNDTHYYLIDDEQPDISKVLPHFEINHPDDKLYISGTNFHALSGRYYYALNEGTYELASRGNYMEGIFSPRGSSSKYRHPISHIKADIETNMIFYKIFASTLLMRNLNKDSITIAPSLDCFVKSREWHYLNDFTYTSHHFFE